MADEAGTLERIAIELAGMLEQIANRLNEQRLLDTFAEMGVAFPDALISNSQFTSTRQSIANASAALGPAVQQLVQAIKDENTATIISSSVTILSGAASLIQSLSSLGASLNTVGPALPGISAAQVTELTTNFAPKFFDLLVVDHMDTIPAVGNILTLLGLIERSYHAGDEADDSKPDYEVVKVRYDRITEFFGGPGDYFESLYDWGAGGYDGSKILQAIHDFVVRFGLPATLHPASGSTPAKLEAFAFDFTAMTGGSGGLAIDVRIPIGGAISLDIPLPLSGWSSKFDVDATLTAGTSAQLLPPFDITIAPPSGEIQGKAVFTITGDPDEPFVLLGQAGGSRMEIGQVDAGVGLQYRWDISAGNASAEPLLSAALKKGKIFIDGSSGDGFISRILSGIKVESNFDIGMAWSMSSGIRFEGSSTIEIELPVHVSLGPISIPSLYIVGGFKDGEIPIEISASLGADLGPLKAVVERMGVRLDFSFPSGGGNIGPAQLDLAFKPPNGVGLSVDAGVIKGGGYLYFDFDKEEYAGALELVFSEFIELKAIGLVTTRMPDGSKGFSLLVIITAEFGTGIQLGYGFTLLGVGGLLGLNRTMRLQPLMEGVRTGAVSRIMFPTNVIENAPRIISDLKNFFPPQEGVFLIGPMAKLGWGTPTLISVSLGIIIEIPGNIAILGVIKVALPTEEQALILLQVSFAGAIEFDKSRLYFFATLYESRVLFITLDGDMGLLVAWGKDANFVLSVGGFHPQFNPPPLPFPNPNRITISILNQSYARIRVMGYFAVTSNSVQFGARAELYFGFSAISIEGHISFDALIQFSPFYFIVQIGASVSLKVFGMGLFSIRLSFSLEGPTPWRAKGTGSLSLLFFEISADFDVTWGEHKNTQLPSMAVMPVLKAEFEKLQNWTAHLPAGHNLLVSLRKLERSADLVLHPVGTLRVSQRSVPLTITIDKVGNQKPSDADHFSLKVSAGGLQKKSDVEESFAMGQFQNMSDGEKVSRAAYEPETSGMEMSAQGKSFASSRMVKRVVRYELIIIDSNFKRFVKRFFVFWGVLFGHFLKGGAVSKSVLSYSYKKQVNPFDEKIQVQNDAFVVAFNTNNKAYNAAAGFNSETSALEFMQQKVAEDPSLSGKLHVIYDDEVNKAA